MGESGQQRGRAFLVNVLVRGRRRPGCRGRTAGAAFGQFAHLPAFGRGEGGKCAPQQGQHLDEMIGRKRAQPRIEHVPERRLMQEHQAASGEKPFNPSRRLRRGIGARKMAGKPGGGGSPSARPAVPADEDIDGERAARLLPTLAHLLGIKS